MALDEGRSATEPVTESFSSAPTCSWDARMVRRILRANQMPAAKKANWARRFPSAYQLLWIQVYSFMDAPWTGVALIYNSAGSVETGWKSRKRTGGSFGRTVCAAVAETTRRSAVRCPHFFRGLERVRAYLRAIIPFEKVLFSSKENSRCGKPGGKSGRPSPMRTGTTPI